MERSTQEKIINTINYYTDNLQIADETFIAKIYLALSEDDKSIKPFLQRIIIDSKGKRIIAKKACQYSPEYNTIGIDFQKLDKNISENIYEFFKSDIEKENILLYNIEVVRLILEEYEQAKLLKECTEQESFENKLLKFSFECDLHKRNQTIKPDNVKHEKYVDYILSEEDLNYMTDIEFISPKSRIAFAKSYYKIKEILKNYNNDKIDDYEKFIYLSVMLNDYYNKYKLESSPIKNFIRTKKTLMINSNIENDEFEKLIKEEQQIEKELDLKERLIYGMDITPEEYDYTLYKCATTNACKKSNARIRI